MAVFIVMAVGEYAGVWRAGISRAVPVTARDGERRPMGSQWFAMQTNDATLAAWLVSRNARTLLTAPGSLFDAEHCAPAKSVLALGEPMLTLGAVAIVPWIVTRDPVATYNLAAITLLVAAAISMFLFVRELTHSQAAAFVAALLYGFNGARLNDISHPFVYDTTWAVLGLYFVLRLFEHGRWRDALGMAVCGALQVGTSFYPLLGSLLATAPIFIALLWRARPTAALWIRLVLVLAGVCMAAYLMFSPYLAMRESTDTLIRSWQYFAQWSWYLPSPRLGITRVAFALAAVALLLLPSSRTLRATDRATTVAVFVGAILTAAVAVGPWQPVTWRWIWDGAVPFRTPNLYVMLSSILPGLDAVRVPARVGIGYHMALCILAGIGVAALQVVLPRRLLRVASVLVVAAVILELTWVPLTASAELRRFRAVEIAPLPETIAFYRELEALDGSTGALFEVPFDGTAVANLAFAPSRILASGYHYRRTSACFGSFKPPGRADLDKLSRSLPSVEAVSRLREHGFTTIVVHLDTRSGRAIDLRLARAGGNRKGQITPLHRSDRLAAYGLVGPSAHGTAAEGR